MNLWGENTKIPVLTMILLTIVYCAFVLEFESHGSRQAQTQLNRHAHIIADDLWNFNPNGAIEYLKLAANSDHYEKLTVISHNGEIFQEITTQFPTPTEATLIRFHLIPRVVLVSRIEQNGNIIGWMEALWIPETLYTHIYVLIFFLLTLLIVFLYNRLAEEKFILEKRVDERTNELTQSNVILKKEIQDRIQAEYALRKSEEKHRFLAENIEDVIWTLDSNYRYTYISPVATRMFGWDLEEVLGSSLSRFLTTDSYAVFQRTFEKTEHNEIIENKHIQPVILELEILHRDKSSIWCEVTISFLIDENNRVTGSMGVARNITEKRRARREKAELQEKLERSKKMESLGILAGGVAHDLNNVLSGIVSYPDLILMNTNLDVSMRKQIETIRESGVKAAEIVNDLLTLARRGVFTTEVLNLNNLIEEYLSSPEYQKMISYHPDTDTFLQLEADLPNIQGSPTPLQKVIMNLVSNAAEAQPNGGRITIKTRSCYLDRIVEGYQSIAEGEYTILSVSDEGEGIEGKDLRRIFEPFYTKKVMGRSGTGLGLTVVWGTIEDHKGYIDISSKKNIGTTIDIYIPISRKSVDEMFTNEGKQSIMGNREKILVVDDADNQREIACAILKKLNYSVESVPSGEEAIDYLKEKSVDLVMLDMIMDNGMDGLETYKSILKRSPRQRAIIASGFSETDRVREAQRLGAGSYIKKPYKLEQLSIVVHRELSTTPSTELI